MVRTLVTHRKEGRGPRYGEMVMFYFLMWVVVI